MRCKLALAVTAQSTSGRDAVGSPASFRSIGETLGGRVTYIQCSKNRKCDRSLERAAHVATTLTLAINRSAAAVGARSTECGAGQGLAASTVGEAAFAVSTTRALNCVAATIAGLAATLTEFDTGFGRADRTDVRNAHFACAGTGPTIDLSATAVVDTTASSSRTDLWGAGLADIGDAK